MVNHSLVNIFSVKFFRIMSWFRKTLNMTSNFSWGLVFSKSFSDILIQTACRFLDLHHFPLKSLILFIFLIFEPFLFFIDFETFNHRSLVPWELLYSFWSHFLFFPLLPFLFWFFVWSRSYSHFLDGININCWTSI